MKCLSHLEKLTAKKGAVFGFATGSILTGLFFSTHPEFLEMPLENIIANSVAAIGVSTFGMAATGYLTEKVNKYFPKDKVDK